MFVIFFTKIWYGKTLPCRTSLEGGTAAAVPAVPAAPPMGEGREGRGGKGTERTGGGWGGKEQFIPPNVH